MNVSLNVSENSFCPIVPRSSETSVGQADSFGGLLSLEKEAAAQAKKAEEAETFHDFIAGKTWNSHSELLDLHIEYRKNHLTGTMCEAKGVKDTDVNWDADGTCQMTEEQAAYLRSKYDISNMDQISRNRLLADLTQMNVISAREFLSQFIKPISCGSGVICATGDTSRAFGNAFSAVSDTEDIFKMLSLYKESLGSMKDLLGSNYQSLGRDQFYYLMEYLEEEAQRCDRFESIFEMLR